MKTEDREKTNRYMTRDTAGETGYRQEAQRMVTLRETTNKEHKQKAEA